MGRSCRLRVLAGLHDIDSDTELGAAAVATWRLNAIEPAETLRQGISPIANGSRIPWLRGIELADVLTG